MKKILVLYILFLPYITFSQSPIRVQNGQNLQTAIDIAPAGAIILVDSGVYGEISLNKKITLLGAGGFGANPSIIRKISFNMGSDNSSIVGFKVEGSPTATGIFINFNVSSILIKNNYILAYISTPKIFCETNCGPIENLSIIHNIITGYIELLDFAKITDFRIKNNVFGGFLSYPDHSHVNYQPITGEITNNNIMNTNLSQGSVFLNPGLTTCAANQNSSVLFKNNIMYFGINYYCFSNTYYFSYNISNKEGLNETNMVVDNFDDFFIGVPSIIGGEPLPFQLQLATNSPGRGAGENGIDCGAFGGSDPFPLSSAIGPQIYELSAPSSVASGQTLNVTVKAKVSN